MTNVPPNNPPPQAASHNSQGVPSLPEARVHRRHFLAVWIIPIIAALIAGYLGVRSYVEHGPIVTITFKTADGLTAGQTAVKYKSVSLGTVENITLMKDHSGVVVHIRMATKTQDILTENARFWVQRPHITTANISDIVSGTYIQVDPGDQGGAYQTEFTGLENPPNESPDADGTTYVIKTERLGSINAGSPVYYRDINVGQVLGYDSGDGFGPITVKVFVNAPYDKLVKPTSRFWNASGFSVHMGAGGLHVELQSLQSVLAGGLAFYTPPDAIKMAQADNKTEFPLYENRKMAEAASYGKSIPCVTYVQSSIKDLATGSSVQIFGIQVGQVTDVKLSVNPQAADAKVRVAFDIEPEAALNIDPADKKTDVVEVVRQMVQHGMRVKMESSDLIAGQELLSLEFAPKTDAADIAMEGNALVLPGEGNESLSGALSDVANKLNQIPFDQIGQNLNHLVESADKNFGGPDMQRTVHDLAETMANAADLSRKANENLTPALQKLPDISSQLQSSVAHANQFMMSLNTNYGQNSDFQQSARRVLDQVNDAARSIRLLADFLERHPEALVEGKTFEKGTKP